MLGATAARAQHDTTSTLRGTVVDSSGHPMSGVEIYVLTVGRGSRTDDAGRYVVVDLLQGPTRLRARLPGWQPVDSAIAIGPRTTVTLNFVLRRRIDALDTVRVVSRDSCEPRGLNGFGCWWRAGIGAFRDAREVAAIKPVYFADVFDGIRGVKRVLLYHDVGIASTTGWRCIAYLANGRPPFPGELRNLNLHDIIAFEFYDEEDKIPEWYKIYSQHCSLAVLWLRGAPKTFANPPPDREPVR
jgi:hypothetical protein